MIACDDHKRIHRDQSGPLARVEYVGCTLLEHNEGILVHPFAQ